MPSRAASSPRCFVALWPDPETRVRLAHETAELCALYPRIRPLAASNLHLTLAFIGALPAGSAGAVADEIARGDLGAPAVGGAIWQVDRIGAFPGARVAWASGGADLLQPIATAVRALLDRLRIDYDRKPFIPHVTLARHAAQVAPGAIVPPIRWRIGAPRLVVSAREGGVLRYRDWPMPFG
jgi:2'-5' RNA ligase